MNGIFWRNWSVQCVRFNDTIWNILFPHISMAKKSIYPIFENVQFLTTTTTKFDTQTKMCKQRLNLQLHSWIYFYSNLDNNFFVIYFIFYLTGMLVIRFGRSFNFFVFFFAQFPYLFIYLFLDFDFVFPHFFLFIHCQIWNLWHKKSISFKVNK